MQVNLFLNLLEAFSRSANTKTDWEDWEDAQAAGASCRPEAAPDPASRGPGATEAAGKHADLQHPEAARHPERLLANGKSVFNLILEQKPNKSV